MIQIFVFNIFRDFLPFVMKHYGDSLQYGNKFIYQSIPKILQFWLDFGANVQDQGKITCFIRLSRDN